VTLRIEIVKRPPGPRAVAAPALGPLIARRRREAETEAVRILDDARAIADRLVCDAADEAAAIRRAAAEEGRSEAERRWTEAALALSESAVAAVDRLESELVRLSIEIARHLVGESLAADPSQVATLAARACRPLRRDAALVLRVSQANESLIGSIREQLGDRGPVVVEVDASLGAGDCIAECAGVRVDATIAAQLENVRRRLAGDEAAT
jgi:flagellar biosynthesis/type III secretory pathway protein FliH